jgi:hypothetical protein
MVLQHLGEFMKRITLLFLLLVSTTSFASEYKIVGAYLSQDQKIVVTLQNGSYIRHISQSSIGIKNKTLECNVNTCVAKKFKQKAGDLYADVLLKNSNEVLEDVFIGSFIEGRVLELDNISVTQDLKILFDVK